MTDQATPRLGQDGGAEAAPVDTVVLDVDGTLVDSNYHHTLAWARAFRASGYDVPLWRIHRSIGMGGERLVPRLIGESADRRVGQDVRDRWEEEFGALIDEVVPLPHAADLLGALRRRPVTVVLASSGKPEHTRRWVQMLAAGDDVDAVTSGDDVATTSAQRLRRRALPDPELIDKAVEAVEGSTALVVGDSVWDAETAQRSGARMVGLLTGGFGRGELGEAGAAIVCENIAELVDRLDDLLAGA
jgi:phosphoglycolate phosphatase-like HAD superfamily hydrolase